MTLEWRAVYSRKTLQIHLGLEDRSTLIFLERPVNTNAMEQIPVSFSVQAEMVLFLAGKTQADGMRSRSVAGDIQYHSALS
jgi:hypothetical protein